MSRFCILLGFTVMFISLHLSGNLNKYINTKYSYLSIIAIVILGILCLVQFEAMYRKEKEEEKKKAAEALKAEGSKDEGTHEPLHENSHDHSHDLACDHEHNHNHEHEHSHNHDHDHFGHDHGHSHGSSSGWKRAISYVILIVPILTGLFLPVQTLDSSFVKAKGFSFPDFDASSDNPGQHQFLKPDTSVYYGDENYQKVKNRELAEFVNRESVKLSDEEFLKGMEVIYNFPGNFMGKTISFNGFAYKGEQADGNHYFIFRFGFIHCVADSGVFGMLVDFPKNAPAFSDDDWVHVEGKLTWEFYQPFKQTIPVLKVTSWEKIDEPKDPYVYRVS
ncbi:TIGR03943 family putative permease subunit [Cohnella faecalis]|uniref:TIGR03943 family protein n=1 Tax=Cohnella faecalis TaxID=2315694 RepID=A0A398CLI2_9BACL|nr:TIGR03943 family protein [Cohnella faecalis]RIE03523.1 TIGR03943 family protein [Cohnella faecalis]